MPQRSVTNGTRRRMTLLRCCCAPLALVLLLGALEQNVRGQSPALDRPANAADESGAAQTSPPPAKPPAAVAEPTLPIPVQQDAGAAGTVKAQSAPAHPSKPHDTKSSKP